MQGDAISSGFACISRRFSAGLLAASQGKSTPKGRQRRRNCASGIFETDSNPGKTKHDKTRTAENPARPSLIGAAVE
jgi:hypothetical protein